MDPLDFRLLNAAREGDRRHNGLLHTHMGYVETLEAAKRHPHYRSQLDGANRGRGVATVYWGNWGGRSTVTASVNVDGTVNLGRGLGGPEHVADRGGDAAWPRHLAFRWRPCACKVADSDSRGLQRYVRRQPYDVRDWNGRI